MADSVLHDRPKRPKIDALFTPDSPSVSSAEEAPSTDAIAASPLAVEPESPPVVPKKRGPGRPRKSEPAPEPVSKPVGRVRKEISKRTLARGPQAEIDEVVLSDGSVEYSAKRDRTKRGQSHGEIPDESETGSLVSGLYGSVFSQRSTRG